MSLLTADGVRTEAAHTPRKAPFEATYAPLAEAPLIVLAHGFTGAPELPQALKEQGVPPSHLVAPLPHFPSMRT